MSRYYFYKDIENPITGERMRIQAADKYGLSLKIQRQYERWGRERAREEKAEKKQLALEKSEAAQTAVESINSILKATLTVVDRIDWISLLDRSPYPAEIPTKEQFSRGSFSKSFSFIPALKRRAEKQAEDERLAFKKAIKEYEGNKASWEADQKEHNVALARKKIAYEKGEPEGVEAYASMVLDRSSYPDTININEELMYESKSQTFLIELDLPTRESLPRAVTYKYIAARDAIEEKQMNDKAFAAFYNNALYQIILRTCMRSLSRITSNLLSRWYSTAMQILGTRLLEKYIRKQSLLFKCCVMNLWRLT